MSGFPELRAAVVGHVEWVEFALVERLPRAGEIVETHGLFQEPAGGGAVAAVQLARLCGNATLFTALGDDRLARSACTRLEQLGVRVCSVTRAAPTRRALTLVEERKGKQGHERTIVTLGERLEPSGEDAQLPWEELSQMDAVYFTAGDLAALREARRARLLLASPRAWLALGHGVALDALVASGADASEEAGLAQAERDAALVVRTEGSRGGAWQEWGKPPRRERGELPRQEQGESPRRERGELPRREGRWSAEPPPGPIADSYGCGDSFAAGLAYGLARGLDTPAALALAARCGAVCLTGRGPYERQLSRAEIPS